MGKFEFDDSYSGERQETFDDWADRIYNAFSGSKKPKLTLDPNKVAYIQLKENHENKKYHRMCRKIFMSDEKIESDDIPLENMEGGKMIDVLLDDVKDKSKEE